MLSVTSLEPSSALLTEFVDGFSLHFVVICQDGLLACFCHKLTYNQTGGYDYDTFVQLTEGRSARNQSKQLPAKKIALRFEMMRTLITGAWNPMMLQRENSFSSWCIEIFDLFSQG